MLHWKTTTNRKKIQRHINSEVRNMNRTIERDDLWRGRFYCRQKEIYFYPSEDKSWVYAEVIIEFIDRKTGKFALYRFRKEDFLGSAWRFWERMNYFITEYVDVWAENPRPSLKNIWDYRKENSYD